MNELKVMNFNGIETVDSRQVAQAIDKPHNDLMKDIRRYSGFLNEGKISLVDFFIESTYTDGKGETRPCYLLTRKGCEMVANKMTGQKGTVFTALYVNAFHAMEEHIKSGTARVKATAADKAKKLEIQEMNARTRMANMYLKLANVKTKSETYKDVLVVKAAEVLSGEQLLQLPETEQRMYTATEIGAMLGVSAQKIGTLANKYGLKTDAYGKWYRDKSKYSNKEVDTFKYNQNGVDKLTELVGGAN